VERVRIYCSIGGGKGQQYQNNQEVAVKVDALTATSSFHRSTN